MNGLSAAPSPSAGSRILSANLLFLTTIFLISTVGTAAQMRLGTWRGGLITEIGCILLPAVLFAGRECSPVAALRLQWVGAAPCLMGLVIGAGLFPLAGAAGLLGHRILGYALPAPLACRSNLADVTLLSTFEMALATPICEELLFRGYILGAYERADYRARTAIFAVAALFTVWHVAPARWPVVAVFAVPITYVAFRTGSVWPPIAAHIGANGSAVLVRLMAKRWVAEPPSAGLVITGGILLMAAALLCLRGVASRPMVVTPHSRPVSRMPDQWWPLLVAGGIIAANILNGS